MHATRRHGASASASDKIAINGGKPLRGRDRGARARRTSSPRRWSPRCSARRPACCRTSRTSATSQVVRGLLEVHGVARRRAARRGRAASSTRRTSRARTSRRSTRTPGSSRIPILFCGPLLHRLGEAFIPDLGGCRIGDRPIDFHLDALRAFGAIVDKLPSGIRITAPNGLQGRQDRAAVPERRRHRAGAADRRARRGHHRAQGRGDRARDHGPHHDPAEDGRDHHGRAPTASSSSRASTSSTATTHRAIFDRNEAASWAAAALATDGDIFVGGAKQPEMLTFLNVFRKVGGAFDDPRGRHPLLPPGGRRSSPSSSRPTCTPAS